MPAYDYGRAQPNNPYDIGAQHYLTENNQICIEINSNSSIFKCRVCSKMLCADCGIRKNHSIYCSTAHSEQHYKLCSDCECQIDEEEFDIEKGEMFNGMMKEEGERESGKGYSCDGCRDYFCCNCIYNFGLDDFDYCGRCNLHEWNMEVGAY
jgi:hypothetical protein